MRASDSAAEHTTAAAPRNDRSAKRLVAKARSGRSIPDRQRKKKPGRFYAAPALHAALERLARGAGTTKTAVIEQVLEIHAACAAPGAEGAWAEARRLLLLDRTTASPLDAKRVELLAVVLGTSEVDEVLVERLHVRAITAKYARARVFEVVRETLESTAHAAWMGEEHARVLLSALAACSALVARDRERFASVPLDDVASLLRYYRRLGAAQIAARISMRAGAFDDDARGEREDERLHTNRVARYFHRAASDFDLSAESADARRAREAEEERVRDELARAELRELMAQVGADERAGGGTAE